MESARAVRFLPTRINHVTLESIIANELQSRKVGALVSSFFPQPGRDIVPKTFS